MSVPAYFQKRPRAETEADDKAALRDAYELKGRLIPAEAARILKRKRDTKLMSSQPAIAGWDDLDPVLRHHLRMDPAD